MVLRYIILPCLHPALLNICLPAYVLTTVPSSSSSSSSLIRISQDVSFCPKHEYRLTLILWIITPFSYLWKNGSQSCKQNVFARVHFSFTFLRSMKSVDNTSKGYSCNDAKRVRLTNHQPSIFDKSLRVSFLTTRYYCILLSCVVCTESSKDLRIIDSLLASDIGNIHSTYTLQIVRYTIALRFTTRYHTKYKIAPVRNNVFSAKS